MATTNNIREDAKRALSLLDPIGPVLVFGNGGSAAIANHMECDITKSTEGLYRVISLSANASMLSAIGNDLGFERTCSAQLEWRIRKPVAYGYTVLLISSSGTSLNIVNGAATAKRLGASLIGFTGNAKGSQGGALRDYSDISVHCDSEDYGEIENYHLAVMHEMVRILKARL